MHPNLGLHSNKVFEYIDIIDHPQDKFNEMIRLLLKMNITPNRNSPLIFNACARGYTETIELLLREGSIDINNKFN